MKLKKEKDKKKCFQKEKERLNITVQEYSKTGKKVFYLEFDNKKEWLINVKSDLLNLNWLEDIPYVGPCGSPPSLCNKHKK